MKIKIPFHIIADFPILLQTLDCLLEPQIQEEPPDRPSFFANVSFTRKDYELRYLTVRLQVTMNLQDHLQAKNKDTTNDFYLFIRTNWKHARVGDESL